MHTKRILAQFSLVLVCIIAGTNVYAADLTGKNRDRNALRNHLWTTLGQPEKVSTAAENGKKLTRFCNTCHGENGISKNPWEANLAEQDPTYLLDQLINFATKKRRNLVMNDLTPKFTDTELVDITVYYSSMKNNYLPTHVNPKQVQIGKTIYQATCARCHGVTGKDIKGFANLSGQSREYLTRSIEKFQVGRLRSSSVMGPIVANLSDPEIDALASYISVMSLRFDNNKGQIQNRQINQTTNSR